jgi:hypothetical protein
VNTIVDRLEFGDRIGGLEVDELSLPRLADQGVSEEDRGADERAERRLDGTPRLDQIGGQIFAPARAVESRDSGARRIERGARLTLFRCAHRTIRSSPATALPRRKLSASWVGMRTPV